MATPFPACTSPGHEDPLDEIDSDNVAINF